MTKVIDLSARRNQRKAKPEAIVDLTAKLLPKGSVTLSVNSHSHFRAYFDENVQKAGYKEGMFVKHSFQQEKGDRYLILTPRKPTQPGKSGGRGIIKITRWRNGDTRTMANIRHGLAKNLVQFKNDKDCPAWLLPNGCLQVQIPKYMKAKRGPYLDRSDENDINPSEAQHANNTHDVMAHARGIAKQYMVLKQRDDVLDMLRREFPDMHENARHDIADKAIKRTQQ